MTTDSKHHLPVAPDLVQRCFTPAAPNLVWSGDITYLATDEGWLYLAAVLDLHSRQVVGWSLQSHMQTAQVKNALLMACFRRNPEAGLNSTLGHLSPMQFEQRWLAAQRKSAAWRSGYARRFPGATSPARSTIARFVM